MASAERAMVEVANRRGNEGAVERGEGRFCMMDLGVGVWGFGRGAAIGGSAYQFVVTLFVKVSTLWYAAKVYE